MHGEALVGVACRLEGAADFAHLHVAVLLDVGVLAHEGLQLCLLLLELVDLLHDSLYFFNFALLSQFLCVFVEEGDLLVELVDLFNDTLLLKRIHFRLVVEGVVGLVVATMRAVLSTHQTSLDLLVHLSHHFGQLHDQLILVLPLVTFSLPVIDELVFKKVVMALFTRTNVSLRVRKQVVRTKR